MCSPTAVMATTSVLGTVMSVGAQFQQARYQKKVGEYNARVAENQAEDVRRAGTAEEIAHREKVNQLLSTQRAQLGAAGVELGFGSAAELQEQTVQLGEADALRIRSQTGQQVEALRTGASLTRGSAALQAGATQNQAVGTLFSGAADVLGTGVADKWFTPNSAAKTQQPLKV